MTIEPIAMNARPHDSCATQEPTRIKARPRTQSLREAATDGQKDYFVERDGLRYAGTHLLVELWEASHLDDLQLIDRMLREAIVACDATLLNLHLHHFTPNGGISGVAVLAESHISIHTWPERCYAAVDIFMCGGADPYKALPILRRGLSSQSVQVCEQKRGLLP